VGGCGRVGGECVTWGEGVGMHVGEVCVWVGGVGGGGACGGGCGYGRVWVWVWVGVSVGEGVGGVLCVRGWMGAWARGWVWVGEGVGEGVGLGVLLESTTSRSDPLLCFYL
jgi:hypothetical protein